MGCCVHRSGEDPLSLQIEAGRVITEQSCGKYTPRRMDPDPPPAPSPCALAVERRMQSSNQTKAARGTESMTKPDGESVEQASDPGEPGLSEISIEINEEVQSFDKPSAAASKAPKPVPVPALQLPDKSAPAASAPKPAPVKEESPAVSPGLTAFNIATQKEDYEVVISLLSDISPASGEVHAAFQWSEPPKTVGSLAAIYLQGAFSDTATRKSSTITAMIDRSLLIDRITENLRFPQWDIVQHSLILLSLLVDAEDKRNTYGRTFMLGGGLIMLHGLMRHEMEDVRMVASKVLRNIYAKKPAVMKELRTSNRQIIDTMVVLLPTFENPTNMLNHLKNVRDYVLDSSGYALAANVALLTQCGVMDQLHEMEKNVDAVCAAAANRGIANEIKDQIDDFYLDLKPESGRSSTSQQDRLSLT